MARWICRYNRKQSIYTANVNAPVTVRCSNTTAFAIRRSNTTGFAFGLYSDH
jgi:hypothetical protein